MSAIHILRQGKPSGPFSEEEIRQQLSRGDVTPADHAWREGMSEWLPLSQVVALPTSPPPPPPGWVPVPAHAAGRAEEPSQPKKRRVPPQFMLAGLNEFLEVFADRLTITPKGGQGLQGHGTAGIREIPVQGLLDIGYKLPGFTSGYLQFTVAGAPGVAARSPQGENTFRFEKTAENIDTAGRITAYLQGRLHEARTVQQSPALVSLSDELGKLAVLRDQGILTHAEFQAAKQRLLA